MTFFVIICDAVFDSFEPYDLYVGTLVFDVLCVVLWALVYES